MLSSLLFAQVSSEINKGEKAFRKVYKLEAGSLTEQGYPFPHDDFFLPDNFQITKKGLLFQYAEYEIASYSMGHPHFFLPFDTDAFLE